MRPKPPLSQDLKDSPDGRVTSSVRRARDGVAPAFQSALPPTVLLPESFRGGCSFGAGAVPGLSRRGATAKITLAPLPGDDQPCSRQPSNVRAVTAWRI